MTELLRPTVLDIDLKTLVANYRRIKVAVAPSRVMAVLKANAYGHGLVPAARALEEEGVDFIGVALIDEALELRLAGVRAPIHVFGGILSEQISHYLAHDIDVTASSVAKLQAINTVAGSHGKKAFVHLKIDTGMGRLGVQYHTCSTLFEAAQHCEHISIRGVFSHLACADEDEVFTRVQAQRFRGCVERFREMLPHEAPLFHLANSAATVRYPDLAWDMVRPGLLLYGAESTQGFETKPCMRLSSKVVYFKVLDPGATVSYGRTWTATERTRIVTVPIGYGDGFFRRLSNIGQVLIRGRRYPIVGRVCMDQMMINIGQDEAYNGDEVVLFGKQGNDEITISEIAHWAETIEHEVLCSTNLRVPRRYA